MIWFRDEEGKVPGRAEAVPPSRTYCVVPLLDGVSQVSSFTHKNM